MKQMMFGVLLVMGLLTGAASPVQAGDDDYVKRWCKDVGSVLSDALHVGNMTDSYEEEKAILVGGITRALELTNDKKQPFVRFTLVSGLNDLPVFGADVARQVEHLRASIRNALSDLDFLEWYLDNKSDKRLYVIEVLERALARGRAIPEDVQEIMVLKNAGGRSVALLDASDNRRSNDYACARRSISDALEAADKLPVGSYAKVQILREGLRSAHYYLQDYSRCRR